MLSALTPGALSRLQHLPREGRDALFLVAVIAWIFLPLSAQLPTWCVALAFAVLAWRAGLAWQSRPLPGRWALMMVLVIAGVGTYLSHRTLLGRDAGVTLLAVLLALKTLELKARRDAFVVFFLGFFTLLTNFFYSQSLLVAASMLVAVLGLLTALVNAHMTVGRPPLARAARIAGVMTLLGAPIMAVLFVLFPRLAPLWGIPSDGMSGRSGLSSQMTVGNVAKLALDESVAFRVEWFNADATAPTPPPPDGLLYFRGPVLSSFDGSQWTALRSRFPPYMAVPPMLAVGGNPIRHRVTLEPNNRPWLFMLETPSQAPNVARMSGAQIRMSADLQWTTNQLVTDITRYDAVSHTEFRHGPLQAAAAIQLQDYVELPPGFNPRTLGWAAELRRELAQANAMELADAVLARLKTGGYSYTLEPGLYGRDSADEFWFDKKAGFCEHIASAFVVVMRALDVPSRVVTGYQGGQVNSVDGIFTVRQSDAHAWTEIWVAGRGWVRIDPTSAVSPGRIGGTRLAAPQTVLGGALAAVSPNFAVQWRAMWDAVNTAWNQRVLNYTQSKQLNVLRNLGFQSPSWEDLARLLGAIVVVVSGLGAAWTLWQRHERDPWLRQLKWVRKQLHDLGIESNAATSPRTLAQRAEQSFGNAAKPLQQALHALELQRYAPAQREAMYLIKPRLKAALQQLQTRI